MGHITSVKCQLPTITFSFLIIIFNPISNQAISSHHHYSSNSNSIKGAYRISPKACQVDNRSGTCMFVWECLKSEGKHLGMCVDGFMFGSCCGHNDTSNDIGTINVLKPSKTTMEPITFQITHQIESTKPFHQSTTTENFSTSISSLVETTEQSTPYLILTFINKNTTMKSPTTEIKDENNDDSILNTSTIEEENLPFVTSNSSLIQEHDRIPAFPLVSSYLNPNQITTMSTTTTMTISPNTSPNPPTTTVETTTTLKPIISSTINPISRPNIENNESEEDFCGKAPLFPQMRIVGGKQSALGQFPWITSIRRTSFFGFSSTHRCGGALLNSNWVATAGHCVDDLLATQIRVRLGEWDFSHNDKNHPHIESTIVKKVVHPSYNFFTYENDIALLKLEKPIQFSKYVRPICLPGNEDLLIGENATVAGWGRLSENGQLPSRLQQVTVPIISNDQCRDMFFKANRVEHIPEIFICAGYENGGQDSCQGDSGGPLQVKGRDGRYFLAGIISWGIGCAAPLHPGVCTRISKYTNWIMSIVT